MSKAVRCNAISGVHAYGRDPNYLILKKRPCKQIKKNDYHGGKHYPDLWIHDLYVSVKLIGRGQRIHILIPKNLFCQNDSYPSWNASLHYFFTYRSQYRLINSLYCQNISKPCNVEYFHDKLGYILDDHRTLAVHSLLCRKQNTQTRGRNVFQICKIKYWFDSQKSFSSYLITSYYQ